jgi:hypothetical protein
MLPTKSNHTKDGCVATSSNCVIWQGPDITCINLCKGDTVSDVVAKLATELCEILDYVNISTYDLSCLDLSVQPTTFDALIQLIITRLCNAETAIDNISGGGSGGNGGSSSICPDNCLVNLPSCLRYTNPSTGSLVTTSSLTNFVQLLGNKICDLQNIVGAQADSIEDIYNTLTEIDVRIDSIESNISTVNISCINNQTSTQLDTAVELIASALCDLEDSVDSLGGSNVESAILKECSGLESSSVLVGSGTMGGLSGWVSNPTTIADSLSNLWLTVCDMRTAIQNVLTNCCTSICNGLSVSVDVIYNSTNNTIELSFTGTIPVGLTANPAITQLTITQPGYTTSVISINIQSIINTANIYSFIKPAGLNENATFTVSGSFTAQSAEDNCSTAIVGMYTPTSGCPTLTVTPSNTSVAYSFLRTSSVTAYVVTVRNLTNIIIAQQTYPTGGSVGTTSNTVSGLSSGQTYTIQIGYDTSGGARWTFCPTSEFTTTISDCVSIATADSSITVTLNP